MPGLTTWVASLPAANSAACWAATVDEPAGSLERDLLTRGRGPDPAPTHLNQRAITDDFGQPVPDPNPLIEPTWQQICAMGYEIPGIGVIGGDVVALTRRRGGSWVRGRQALAPCRV